MSRIIHDNDIIHVMFPYPEQVRYFRCFRNGLNTTLSYYDMYLFIRLFCYKIWELISIQFTPDAKSYVSADADKILVPDESQRNDLRQEAKRERMKRLITDNVTRILCASWNSKLDLSFLEFNVCACPACMRVHFSISVSLSFPLGNRDFTHGMKIQ